MLVLRAYAYLSLSWSTFSYTAQAGQQESSAIGRADCNLVLGTSPLRLPAHWCLVRKGRLDDKQEVCPGDTTFRRASGKATVKKSLRGLLLKQRGAITFSPVTLFMNAHTKAVH